MNLFAAISIFAAGTYEISYFIWTGYIIVPQVWLQKCDSRQVITNWHHGYLEHPAIDIHPVCDNSVLDTAFSYLKLPLQIQCTNSLSHSFLSSTLAHRYNLYTLHKCLPDRYTVILNSPAHNASGHYCNVPRKLCAIVYRRTVHLLPVCIQLITQQAIMHIK